MFLNELFERFLLTHELIIAWNIEAECSRLCDQGLISRDGCLTIREYNRCIMQNTCSVNRYLQVLDRILSPTSQFIISDLQNWVDKQPNL